jgi:exosortase D (VPLPA-CTERM-specific)
MMEAPQHPKRRCGWFDSIPCALLVILSLALVAFAFCDAAKELLGAWQTDEYSHGIIVPFIAFLLAWHRLVAVRPVLRPSWWGISMLAASGGLLLVGVLAAFEAAAEYGLIFCLAGLSLAFLGCAATRAMAPGFVYLLFVVPLPHIVYSALSQDLQLLSSTLGVWCLDVFGIPVFQEGNVIDLGGYKLQVVDACSGLRYLFPLMSFGYLVAYLLEDCLWKRAVIFFSAIPIAIGMNSLRIAFIGITVDVWGGRMAEGFVHDFEGWVIFLLCVALLMAEVWVLLRIGKRGRFRFEYLGPARGALVSGVIPLTAPVVAGFTLSVLLALLLGTGAIDRRAELEPRHPPFFSFPLVLNEWKGRPLSLEPEMLRTLGLSDYWLADYRRGGDKVYVNFYMAYYSRQRVGSEAHSPANCIPGGGWQIVSGKVKTIVLAGGESLSVSRLLIRREGIQQLVYYWFDERGRDITDTYKAKWHLLIDSVVMRRTDGALIRLVTPLAGSENEADAAKRLDDFLAVSYPVLNSFIPGGTGSGNLLLRRGDVISSRPRSNISGDYP